MLAAADPDTMKLDEKIAPIDLSTETAVAEWFRAVRARGINFPPGGELRRAGQRREWTSAIQR